MAERKKQTFLRSLECTAEFEDVARRLYGARNICGIDECARGNWFGPTVAGAVILPEALPDSIKGKLRDSKLISPPKRAMLAEEIKACAVAWNVATIDVDVIDRIGIHQAAQMAMEEACHGLDVVPDYLLIDSVSIDFGVRQLSINHGDALSVSIAAASILAKTHHTVLMEQLDAQFPAYGFCRHKGYGTKEHMAAIEKHGLTPLHRRSFSPIKTYATKTR